LLDYVAEIPGIERIRYTTSHPSEFGQRLIEAYARLPQLVSHVHLPVQHGSDRILAAMKRGYTATEYRSTIRKLRAARPEISISTDFIVGFPGETDADHARSMKLVDDIGFDHSFSFVFSPRPGTPAAALIGPRTYSSGEALAYHFRAQRLGPLVGEPTPGAADHVTPIVLASHVRANLPRAYVVDAVTGANWEQTGVVPDVPCAEAEAMERALEQLGSGA
jgi:hypothetical protein